VARLWSICGGFAGDLRGILKPMFSRGCDDCGGFYGGIAGDFTVELRGILRGILGQVRGSFIGRFVVKCPGGISAENRQIFWRIFFSAGRQTKSFSLYFLKAPKMGKKSGFINARLGFHSPSRPSSWDTLLQLHWTD
jgi:hypothetical protein